MNLLRMSFSAAIIIVVIIVLRALWIHKLPKKMFLVLWSVAVLRLLIPFSFPSVFSVYALIAQNPFMMSWIDGTGIVDLLPVFYGEGEEADSSGNGKRGEKAAGDARSRMAADSLRRKSWGNDAIENQPVMGKGSEKGGTVTEGKWGNGQLGNLYQKDTSMPIVVEGYAPIWMAVWLAGMSACILFFSVTYILCCRRFRTSLPVENDIVKEWLLSHKIRRKISVRQSDCISAPLAYGFFRPVILMPKGIKWENSRQLQYILEHEFIHIRRLDAVAKLFLAAAVCVHWFNPVVWIMYVLANRDMELSCDEGVIRHFGLCAKSDYALSLIHMEEIKGGLISLGNNFSKNAAEERIIAIMKLQKLSVPAYILAFVFVLGITAVFATSAAATGQEAAAGQQAIVGRETRLSESQQKELLGIYQEYGVSEKDGILYYKSKPIRLLADKYLERTSNRAGGMTTNTIRVYTYFNEAGTVDVKPMREDKTGKTDITELYRDVADIVEIMPTAVENRLLDIPRECVDRLAMDALEEGRYVNVKKMIPYTDEDVMCEIAERMVEEGEEIDEMAAYLSADFTGSLAETGYKKWGISYIRGLLPYVPKKYLESLEQTALQKKDDKAVWEIMDFLLKQM